MVIYTKSFCVVCTNCSAVVKKAFFDININEATQAIADIVAEAAEYFGNNDFDVFIIKIRNN